MKRRHCNTLSYGDTDLNAVAQTCTFPVISRLSKIPFLERLLLLMLRGDWHACSTDRQGPCLDRIDNDCFWILVASYRY